ncbi:MAG: acyltransferase [Phocaeicola sp.]
MSLKSYIKQSPLLKRIVYRFLMHPVKTRPNWWIQPFLFLFIKRGKHSVIYRSVRKDITPFHPCSLGAYSVIEDFCCINNAIGEIEIGHHTRIGLHNTIIGPVKIGNHVNIAQGVVVSGMNHNHKDLSCRIDEQGVSTHLITIEDDVWIGANCTLTAGITIGKHSVIGAGSVVTKDIPANSVAVGVPAKVI